LSDFAEKSNNSPFDQGYSLQEQCTNKEKIKMYILQALIYILPIMASNQMAKNGHLAKTQLAIWSNV
jgi:hypothetical protein